MNKATEAAKALNNALAALHEVVNVALVTATSIETTVIVNSERDLAQIPGEVQAVEKHSVSYPMELRKECGGVTFKYLVARTA